MRIVAVAHDLFGLIVDELMGHFREMLVGARLFDAEPGADEEEEEDESEEDDELERERVVDGVRWMGGMNAELFE